MASMEGKNRSKLLMYLSAAIAYGSILWRFLSSYRAVSQGGKVMVPAFEPDVFYHLKRAIEVSKGHFDILWLDPSLNYPCQFRPPWPWGFDGLIAAIIGLFDIFGAANSKDGMILIASCVIPIIAILGIFVLHRILISLDEKPFIVLSVLMLVSFHVSVMNVAYFGAVDNKTADFVVMISFFFILLQKWHVKRPVATAAVMVSLIAVSDVALLVVCVYVTAHMVCGLISGGVQRHEARLFQYLMAIGTAAFISLEYSIHLERSYTNELIPLLIFLISVVVLHLIWETRVGDSLASRVGTAIAAVAVFAASLWLSKTGDLIGFFSGKDEIAVTIGEATPGWIFWKTPNFALYAASVFAAIYLMVRKRTEKAALIALGGVTVISFVLCMLQIKFRYLMVVPISMAVMQIMTYCTGVIEARIKQRSWVLTSFTAVALVAVGTVWYKPSYHIEKYEEKTLALYETVNYIKENVDEKNCTMITHPNYGTAINYLTGCKISASTFWGDPCSQKMHMKTINACKASLWDIEKMTKDLGFNYMLVEAPESYVSDIRRSPFSVLHVSEYHSTDKEQVRALILIGMKNGIAPIKRR